MYLCRVYVFLCAAIIDKVLYNHINFATLIIHGIYDSDIFVHSYYLFTLVLVISCNYYSCLDLYSTINHMKHDMQ